MRKKKKNQAQLASSGQISNLKTERAVVGLIVIGLSAFLKNVPKGLNKTRDGKTRRAG